jgi:hypothetical protein
MTTMPSRRQGQGVDFIHLHVVRKFVGTNFLSFLNLVRISFRANRKNLSDNEVLCLTLKTVKVILKILILPHLRLSVKYDKK